MKASRGYRFLIVLVLYYRIYMLVLSINVTSGIIEFDKMTHKGGDRASRNTMSQNWSVVVAIVTEGDN